MLEMRTKCETCGTELPAGSTDAVICSFECTFCAKCGGDMNHRCPNCGGELVRRPVRAV
jgi:hypothetical protein